VARSMGSVGSAALGDAETSTTTPTTLTPSREGIFSVHSKAPLLESPPPPPPPPPSSPPPPLPPGHQHAPRDNKNNSNTYNEVKQQQQQQHIRRSSASRPTILDPDGDGIDGIDVDGLISNVHGGIASTASGIAATVRKHHKAIAGKRGEKWHRHSVHSHVPPKLVTERNGAIWNVTVPCRAVARHYPDSYALVGLYKLNPVDP
jgi:hypothetical protein